MTGKTKLGVIVALIICTGLFMWMNRPPTSDSGKAPKPQKPMVLPDDFKLLKDNWSSLIANAAGGPLGNPNAPWAVVEFGDFQCPMCGKAHAFVERMVQKSNGQVKAYFVNFPLVKEHKNARSAALAGLAAGNQGKFWEMYEAMYANQDNLNATGIQGMASGIQGLDMKRFQADWTSPSTAAALDTEVALVNKVEVQITPTFVLRSSKGGGVQRFIGNFGQKIDPIYPGLRDLMESNPWHATYEPEDMPDLSREQ